MKTIILTFIVVLLLQPVLAMEGDFKGDTLRYKFEKMLVEYTSVNVMKNSLEVSQMKSNVEQIQKVLAEMNISPLAENERVTIVFREMGDQQYVWNYKEIELARTQINSKNIVVFDDGTTFEKDLGRYCLFFSHKSSETKIYIDDLSDLEFFFTDDFSKKINEAEDYLQDKFGGNYKKGILAWVDLRNEEVKGYFQNVSYKTNDMIILEAGVGSGFIKNQIISSFGFRIGFAFGNKGLFRNKYFVDYELFYDFGEHEGGLENDINGFLSLGYEHNFSTNPDKDNWYGISLGYLVDRNNDFFGKNTFKVSVLKRINNSITILPEIYFDDFYKNGSPGLRVQVTF
jgi:hypothetical protein